MQEVDAEGLDKQDRRYLETLIRVFEGGPTGVEALAATMNVAVDTLSDEVEPYLLRREFLVRSPRGRQVTAAAYTHLNLPVHRPSSKTSQSSNPSDAYSSEAPLESGRQARISRSRTARHSGKSGGRTATIAAFASPSHW